jgi:hypothetical protein
MDEKMNFSLCSNCVFNERSEMTKPDDYKKCTIRAVASLKRHNASLANNNLSEIALAIKTPCDDFVSLSKLNAMKAAYSAVLSCKNPLEDCKEANSSHHIHTMPVETYLDSCLVSPVPPYEADDKTSSEGLKFDDGKQSWYSLPLEVLQPLADVFKAGEKKYATFNCLKPFKQPERRFYDAMMRHTEAQQIDPLAIDPETGCYHAAQVAFNALMRIYHCKK